MKNNIIRDKSYKFALDVIEAYKFLKDKKEYILSKQLLRSGTSIGANIEEATQGLSNKEFIAKLSISLKEAFETGYWLRLLYDSKHLQDINDLENKVNEIIAILTSIIKTSKQKTE